MSDSTRSPVSFAQRAATRTCPACGDTLKSYDHDGRRVLVCLGCAWGIANESVPPGGLGLPKRGDGRQEQVRGASASSRSDKGGA